MNDRPTAGELVSATRHFLETDLLPTVTDGRLRFQTLIAANVLSIVERELAEGDEALQSEWQELAELLTEHGPQPAGSIALRQAVHHLNQQLCERIRRGEYNAPELFRPLAQLQSRIVRRKLKIANPRYLASFWPS